MAAEGVVVPAPPDAVDARAERPWYMLFVLVLLYLTSQLDRMIVGLLIPMIKADLHLTDIQISLVHGLAFAIFFCVLGVPLGYMVDRFPRRLVILGGILTWSLATLCCGLARGLNQLLLARLVVGAGEAALSPSAYSLMGDAIPRRRLALAFSLFGMGATLGNGVAFGFGGLLLSALPVGGFWLAGRHVATWQVVLMAAAVPALLVMPLVLTFPEPRRRERLTGEARPPLSDALRFIAARRGFYAPMFLAYGALLMCMVGWVSWAPTYVVRHFGRPLSEVSLAFAVFASVAVSISMIVVGQTIDHLVHRRGSTDAPMRVLGCVALVFGVLVFLAVRATSYPAFLATTFLVFMCYGVAAAGAAIPMTTPNEFRGQVSSVYLLVSNAMGYGLGPTLVALCTDLVFRDEARLGDSLALTMAILAPTAALLFWLACAPMRRAVADAAAWRR